MSNAILSVVSRKALEDLEPAECSPHISSLIFTPPLVSHGATVRPCAPLLLSEKASLPPLSLGAGASFYLQSDPVVLMCADTIGRRTQKLKLKEENENGFHARLVQ